MREYTADRYRRLVEETDDPTLRRYMEVERDFLARVPDAGERTFVDLGAGHGRVIGHLSSIGGDVLAIEINPDMFDGLAERAAALPNVRAVQGDMLQLAPLLDAVGPVRPVFLILQNSLGTIEGDAGEVLRVIGEQMARFDGDLVLSLQRQDALPGWGLEVYASIREMVGDYDPAASDLDAGRFVTTTGYTSKWWSDAEIDELKRLGRVEEEQVEDEFHLVRLGAAA